MYQQIQDLLDKIEPYPEKPKKPVLLTGATSDDIRRYADSFAVYEGEFAEFEAKRIDYYKRKGDIEHMVADLIKSESGLDSIPEKYRDKIWSIAWEEGHSSGYHEVYQWLCKLVEIFE
jgi:hypothetical protein